jgi:hypothetical protein
MIYEGFYVFALAAVYGKLGKDLPCFGSTFDSIKMHDRRSKLRPLTNSPLA